MIIKIMNFKFYIHLLLPEIKKHLLELEIIQGKEINCLKIHLIK